LLANNHAAAALWLIRKSPAFASLSRRDAGAPGGKSGKQGPEERSVSMPAADALHCLQATPDISYAISETYGTILYLIIVELKISR
jgi:hypothetical protein